jgi:hypothetical protein
VKYRKKPVVIEALRIEVETNDSELLLDPNTRSIATISGWMMAHGFRDFVVHGEEAPFGIAIETLEGVMVASPGDYIIRGVQGEFYPCKPDIFDQTYLSIDTESAYETAQAVAQAVFNAVKTIKKTGGAVEIHGVRIEPCDEFGATATTRILEAAVPNARAEVKAAVEEWFSNVSLDDLFAVKGWTA